MKASLFTLQSRFQNSLLQKGGACGEEKEEEENPSYHRGLEVYRNNIKLRLENTLSETYPVCKRLVGESFFRGLASHYIKAHPPTHFSLNAYGEGLSQFVASFAPAKPLPYLGDVVNLEWQIHQILMGEEQSSNFDINQLQDLITQDPAEIHFTLKNKALIHSVFPIDKIWQANQMDYTGEETINLQSGGGWIILSQKRYELAMETLTQAMFDFLKAIEKGSSLKTLQTLFSDLTPLSTEAIRRGWIAGVAHFAAADS